MKKYLSMFLAILMLVSMIPVMTLAEDTGEESSTDEVSTLANQGNESFDDHTFGHLDVRIAGATFTLKHNIKDAQGNVITTATEQVTASVTQVHSVTINDKTYTGFSNAENTTYEFRKTRDVAILGKDITDSTKAVIVVDLVDKNGKEYKNISFTLNKSKIVQAAEDCDGRKNGKYDGLDFKLEGALSEDEVKVTVESTDLTFEITKKLDGELCTTADLFEFEVYQGDTLVGSAKNDANGKAVITISYEGLTDYSNITYTIKEKVGSDEYEYDTNVYTIVIGFSEPEKVSDTEYVRRPYVVSGDIENLVFNNITKTTEKPEPTDSSNPSDTPAPKNTPAPSESADPSEEPTTDPTTDPTPSTETKYNQADFTIVKKVENVDGLEEVALAENTTFTFQITNFADLTAKGVQLKFAQVGYNQVDITDGTFTLTVSAGYGQELNASGTLTVLVPKDDENGVAAKGYIKEVGGNHPFQYQWEYDQDYRYFYVKYDMVGAGNNGPDDSFEPVNDKSKLVFTNKFDSSATPTPVPTPTPAPEYVNFTIVKNVVDASGSPFAVEKDTTFTFKIANFYIFDDGYDAKDYAYTFQFNGQTLGADRTFTLKVKAGETSAEGTLTIGIPADAKFPDGTWLKIVGYIEEFSSDPATNWTLDENKQWFFVGDDLSTGTQTNYNPSESNKWNKDPKTLTFTNTFADYKYFYLPVEKVVKAIAEKPEGSNTFTFKVYGFATLIEDTGNRKDIIRDGNLFDFVTLAFNSGSGYVSLGSDRTFTLTVGENLAPASGTLRVGVRRDVVEHHIITIKVYETTGIDWRYYYSGDGVTDPWRNASEVWGLNINSAKYTDTCYRIIESDGLEGTPTPIPTDKAVFVNEYLERDVAIAIPVEKVVEQTGAYAPSSDTTFDFQLNLSNWDSLTVKFGDTTIGTDGKFSLTVKAGQTTASDYVYISGSVWKMRKLTGSVQEIVPETTDKWTYDTKVYSFELADFGKTKSIDGYHAGYCFDFENDPYITSFYYKVGDEQAPASTATFTNQYYETVPRTNLTVKKVWQDKGYEEKRPESITVELYYYQKDKDGKDTKTKVLYKVNGEAMTAVLGEGDDWTYTFENLDARFTWTVDEVSTPAGYSRKVTLSSDKKTVTVTNTYGAQPKTGFDGLPLILCMVAVLLAGGVALVVINRKKTSRKGN